MNNNDEKHSNTPQIWAIGGGKGGVGKSLVTANTSICLALLGHKVAVIDLDLGGANLHTCLGVPIPEKTLSDFVTKQVDDIRELLTPTPIDNLKIISGAQDALGIANLQKAQQIEILEGLKSLDVDYIVFDLGAGTTINTLDFFINANLGILVALPEPTSIENTYRFLKSVFFRKLKSLIDNPLVDELINETMNAKLASGSPSPAQLIDQISEQDSELGEKIRNEFKNFTPQLVINQVRTPHDIEIGNSIVTVSKRYFDLDMNLAGTLDFDASVWQSVKNRKPLLMEFPQSRLVYNFEKLINNLLKNKGQ